MNKQIISLVMLCCLVLTSCGSKNTNGKDEIPTENDVIQSNATNNISEASTEATVEKDDSKLWREAYLTYLNEKLLPEYYYTYEFIYVDDDNIPELVLNSGAEAGGNIILTFHDGMTDALQTNRIGFSYIEKQNLLNNCGGHQGYYFDYIYKIVEGKWEKILSGEYWSDDIKNLVYDEELNRYHTDYYSIDDIETSEEDYLTKVSDVYDNSSAKVPDSPLIIDEVFHYLETGDYISANHKYEIVIDDCTWLDAQEKCHDKGGYLATLTCPKEIERVEEMIRNEGMDNSCFFVGCRRGAEMSPNSYPRYGLFWDDLSLRDPSCIGKWFHDEPSFSGITSNGVEVREDFVAFEKGKDLNEFFFKDVTNNIIKYYPEYSGKLGYICEFDDEDDTQLRINNSIAFLYSLEGLSADEIVEECNIYLNNKLNSSQSDSDYEKVFKVRPMSMEESDNSYDAVYYRFIPVFGTAFNCNPGLDLIKRINVSRGSGEPQPGFEAYAEWKRMSVSIDLDIQDREKAIQVYEKFYEQLAPLYENSFEIRDDTYWSSAGSFWNEDHTLSSGVQLVCLAEHDDSYDIFVIKWHNVE